MIRRKPRGYQVKTSHERWLVSYSDFITLLFAFFVVMYSVSQVSENKYKVLSETLSNAFKGKVAVTMEEKTLLDNYPLDEGGDISGLSPVTSLAQTKDLAQELSDALVHLVKAGDVTINATEEWLQLDLNSNILFDSASAELTPQANELFTQLADVLAPFTNAIEVSGHTDDQPIYTDRFHNNWELSAARAASVVSVLDKQGVDASRLSAVGFGEFQPRATNQTEAGRAQNRRVVVLVARTEAKSEFITPAELGEQVPPETAPVNESPTPSDASEPTQSDEVQPVRRDNGNLLFSSDPDLPRDN